MIMTRMAAAVLIMVIMVMIMVIMTMAGMRITWFLLNVKGPSSYLVQEKVSSELSHVSCDSGREPTPDSV